MDNHLERNDPPELQGEMSPEGGEEENPRSSQEEEEPITWDGNEAELVADDDAAEYEDQNTGIRINYTLREDEIYECLKRSGFIKTTGKRAAVETVILGVLAVAFFAAYLVQKITDPLIFSVICLLLIAVIWIVPYQGIKKKARRTADGKEIKLSIYPDVIEIGEGSGYWEIPLDGACEWSRQNNMIFLYALKGRILILPLRSVEPAVLPEVEAMIMAGAQKREED